MFLQTLSLSPRGAKCYDVAAESIWNKDAYLVNILLRITIKHSDFIISAAVSLHEVKPTIKLSPPWENLEAVHELQTL